MKKIISSLFGIMSSFFCEMEVKNCFMTSAKVVMDASGLRIEAIRSIAREQDIEIEDEQSRCIDENLLEELANTHVRRLKSYFNNTRRHISEASGADIRTFVEFCETFKKHQVDSPITQTWNDIDMDAIREQFLKKVHTSTTDSKEFGDSDLFAGCFCPIHRSRNTSHDDFIHKEYVINCVICSFWYQNKPINDYVLYKDRRSAVKKITKIARYYIFPKSDDDDSFCDSANFINCVQKNVV